MIRLLLSTLLLALSTQAYAVVQTAAIKWVPMTTRENGEAFAITELAKYEIEFVNMDTMRRGVKTAKAGTKGYALTPSTPGRYGFRLRAVDIDGLQSKWTDQVIVTLLDKAVTPPPDPCNCICP